MSARRIARGLAAVAAAATLLSGALVGATEAAQASGSARAVSQHQAKHHHTRTHHHRKGHRHRASPTPAQGNVAYDAQFIESLQRSDGSILSSPGGNWIEPYLANYAAWGLARAARFSDKPAFDAAAWRWLSWYVAHMDSNGYVQDYKRNGDTNDFEPSDSMDSTDGTGGVFLLAVWAASNDVPGQMPTLKKFWPAVQKAVAAIESTSDTDGLTFALPTWPVKYLMDNAEALGGLDAAYAMATETRHAGFAAKVQADADRLQAGIDSLWDSADNDYYWALNQGQYVATDWSVLYPDTVEQAWAVAYGATAPDRAAALMSQVKADQPQWDQPTAMATYWNGSDYQHTVDFWSIVGWAFDQVGDRSYATDAAASIRAGAWQLNRQLPFTDGFQGQLIRLESGAADMPPAITVPADSAASAAAAERAAGVRVGGRSVASDSTSDHGRVFDTMPARFPVAR